MRDRVIIESPAISFPIGYHDLHPDISINFQLNRFYGWAGDDSMLTEMRQAAAGVAGVQDYPTFTKSFIDLGEIALARREMLKGAYYLRLERNPFRLCRRRGVQRAHTRRSRSSSRIRPA